MPIPNQFHYYYSVLSMRLVIHIIYHDPSFNHSLKPIASQKSFYSKKPRNRAWRHFPFLRRRHCFSLCSFWCALVPYEDGLYSRQLLVPPFSVKARLSRTFHLFLGRVVNSYSSQWEYEARKFDEKNEKL